MAYRSEVYVFDDGRPVPVVVRNYTEDDFSDMIRIQTECFPPPFPSDLWWNEEQLINHVTLFPEGALCIEVDGRLAGSLTGVCVQFDPANPSHKWEEMTDNGNIRNHNPEGNTLYIVDIAVSPQYRKLGLGKLLMEAMYQVTIQLNLDRLLGGGRMPGYHRNSSEMTAEEYVRAIISGDINDPVITFLLRCGRTPVAVVENYLEDEESLNYGLLMEWKNPFI
jgi:ribosomal protein S18 acetylase RimI-like enzyme